MTEPTAEELKQIRGQEDKELLDSLDPGIRNAVRMLREANVSTTQSCEGGEGHSSVYPFIHFSGGPGEGYRVMNMAINTGLPITRIGRFWYTHTQQRNGRPILGDSALPLCDFVGLSLVFES